MLIAAAGAVAGFAADYILGKAVDKLGSGFKTGVIERWSRRRADEYVRTFCAVVVEGCNEADVEARLDSILDDEQKSQCLFDAYRRVVLSASPILGPRIIALISAKVIGENRQPTIGEEQMLAAAERMSDAELVEVRDYFIEHIREHSNHRHGGYFETGYPDDIVSATLWDMGPAFAKLESAGLASVSIKIVRDDREGLIGPQKLKLASHTLWSSALESFSELITRAEAIGKGESVTP